MEIVGLFLLLPLLSFLPQCLRLHLGPGSLALDKELEIIHPKLQFKEE